jgi:hypothetical protein
LTSTDATIAPAPISPPTANNARIAGHRILSPNVCFEPFEIEHVAATAV